MTQAYIASCFFPQLFPLQIPSLRSISNTFPLPEIIYDPSLMLSPHTFLFGILFHNNAFRAPGIKSIEDLRHLWAEDGRQQIEVPLKRDKAKHYVFCKVKGVCDKIQIHRDQPISQSTLSRQLKIFGEIAGFKWSLFTRRFRNATRINLHEAAIRKIEEQDLPKPVAAESRKCSAGVALKILGAIRMNWPVQRSEATFIGWPIHMSIIALSRSSANGDTTPTGIVDSLRLLRAALDQVEEPDGYWHKVSGAAMAALTKWDEQQRGFRSGERPDVT
ncbi:hypothetical protein BDV36DRAFT_298672 [Aspergillus pseudocaelatus]|uniref:Uncharacterized protein n=1 Tax=Aspergillus pseudocaelatus TaxID=1825620 RepID=A0ABQ6WCI9_9EURO|nr:hypothetical protein BDV36DRAFT_298672 [Aspergillus pseudocaelatus]